MKALILAAGLGSRLKNNTKTLPKALVNINGFPILYYQLNALKVFGINNIGIVLGYNGNKIKNYIKRYHSDLNIHFFENDLFDQSNSSYSFWKAKGYVENSDYIHFNCDIIFSHSLLNKIISSSYPNVIAVRSDLNLKNGMENVTIKENRIVKMSLINTREANGKAFGLAKFSSKSVDLLIKKLESFISKGDLNQNYYGMIRSSVNEDEFYCLKSNKKNLLEVNTVSDLTYANSNWIK